MTENNKLPTINLKGKEYVQVKDRVIYFNENYPNGKIATSIITSNGDMVTFKCKITPDIATPTRYFTGHSFGTLQEVKAFEKLESVAVGRCLAMMGIGVIESIASADEMHRFNSREAQKEITRVKAVFNPEYGSCPVCKGARSPKTTKTGKKIIACDTYFVCLSTDKSAVVWDNNK